MICDLGLLTVYCPSSHKVFIHTSPLLHLPLQKTLPSYTCRGYLPCPPATLHLFLSSHTRQAAGWIIRMVVSQPPDNDCDKCVCWQVGQWCCVSLSGAENSTQQAVTCRARVLKLKYECNCAYHFPWAYVCCEYLQIPARSSGTTHRSAMINPDNLINFQPTSSGHWSVILMLPHVWKTDTSQRVKSDV